VLEFYIFVLHSRAPIRVGKRNTYKGRDWGQCRWRRRGSKDQAIRKHLETRLGPSDHSVRIHRRSRRYSRRRSLIWRHRCRTHGCRWCGLSRSLGVDDQRGRPLMRWWTIRGRRSSSSCAFHSRRLQSCTWRSRCRCGCAWRSWGCLSHVRRNRHRRGCMGHKSRRDCRCGQMSHKWLEAWGNHRGGLAGHRGGRTCRGSRVLMVETMEPDSKRKSSSVRLGEAVSGKLSSSKTTC
jgi:hypothetical protein